jgi:hypothetical protein
MADNSGRKSPPDVSGYISERVFEGKRILSKNAAAEHRAQAEKARRRLTGHAKQKAETFSR